ncbi:MAG: porin family protein [Chitinophagales bacterium]
MILRTCYLVLLSFTVNQAMAQVELGVTAGATFPTYKVSSGNVSMTSDIKVGFTAGIIAFYNLSEKIGLMPELNFVQKGGILNVTSSNIKNSSTYNYIELPLNIVYNFKGSTGSFFIGAGPAFGLGLGGSYKITGMYEESGDIHFGSSGEDDLKPFEFSLNFVAGYKFSHGFLIKGNYNFGINNIAPSHAGSDAAFHNRYFAITVGYFFLK